MGNVTYKDIFQLVSEQIDNRINYRSTASFRNQLDTNPLTSALPNSLSDISASSLVSSIQSVLQTALPGFINTGLDVEATDPVSRNIIVRAGKGSKGGLTYELKQDITVPVPIDTTVGVFIVSLYRDNIIIDKEAKTSALPLAKIIIPQPGKFFNVYDKKVDREDDWDAYIVSYQEVKFYGDRFGNLEEESIEFLRANIGPVLADNIIGNIRLSEDLKITNTQGTLSLDSSALKLYNSSGGILAKFNQDGTFYYDSNGTEIARFATDSAKIGNMLITKNAIQSGDFISESRGFRIQDTGYAEFENVRIRGKISSSVFEYDKISSVGGKLYVGNASVLSSDMSALDSATLTVDSAVFAVGDVLTIKDATNQEYLLVTSIASAPTYTVTRDLAATFSANNNPAWSKGIAVVSTGNGNSGSLSGFILMDAVSQYAPFIDIASRNSTTYNDYVTKARLGNLSGITDSMFGALSGYGLYSCNVYLRGALYAPDIKTATAGARIELNTCYMSGYNSAGARMMNLCLCGTEVGDFCIGDFSNNCGLMWDASACSFCVRGQLNASDIVTGFISANRICAGCIFTSCGITIANVAHSSGAVARTEFTSTGIDSYDCTGALNFCLCDGHIQAKDIRLQDPNCVCCYSFLDAGKLKFHDELGPVPYVNRICSGQACAGCWVCLLGWRTAPEVLVSVKSLNSYSAANSAQDQRWDIYADHITSYCNSDATYGYCFQVHAALQLASGVSSECLKNSNFGVCICTQAGVCSTKVRLKFELYCHGVAPANWCYGQLCYAICYRCLGCLVWCATCYLYNQPHSTITDMSTPSEATQTVSFPSSQTWEIMACQVSLTWVDSGIASGAIVCCLCTRAVTAGTICSCACLTQAGIDTCLSQCVADSDSTSALTVAGSYPTNVFCTYICYCWCSVATCNLRDQICACCLGFFSDMCQVACSQACVTLSSGTVLSSCTNNVNFHKPTNVTCTNYCCESNLSWTSSAICCSITNQNYTHLSLCTSVFVCDTSVGFCTGLCICQIAVSNICLPGATINHCYCASSGAADSCTLEQICSLCDTFGTACVLDSTGNLNWLAIAYT